MSPQLFIMPFIHDNVYITLNQNIPQDFVLKLKYIQNGWDNNPTINPYLWSTLSGCNPTNTIDDIPSIKIPDCSMSIFAFPISHLLYLLWVLNPL